jgi:hypothetical protein
MTRTALLALSLSALALPAAAEEMKFMAELTGAAQVPPVETEAMGMADVTVDTEAMTVTWRMMHEGLSGDPVAAHFHGPATPEENAPPVIDMALDLTTAASATATAAASSDGTTETATETSSTEGPIHEDILEGSADITEEQLAQLRDGLMYINIHTPTHPDGEIRGQVMEGEADMSAMDAASE